MKRFLLALLVVWLVCGCTPEMRGPFDGAAAAFKGLTSGRFSWSDLWRIRGRYSYRDVESVGGGDDGW